MVNRKVFRFKIGYVFDVWSDLEDLMKVFRVRVGYNLVVELVMMNIYCFLFVFLLFMCNNEYIIYYF